MTIAGNCWNCDKPGHTSQDCRQPRRDGCKSLVNDEDENDDSRSDESTGMAGLPLGCFDECNFNYADISWRVPLFDDLFNVSREAASRPSDEAGESRDTLIRDIANIDAHKLVDEQAGMLLASSAVSSDS